MKATLNPNIPEHKSIYEGTSGNGSKFKTSLNSSTIIKLLAYLNKFS